MGKIPEKQWTVNEAFVMFFEYVSLRLPWYIIVKAKDTVDSKLLFKWNCWTMIVERIPGGGDTHLISDRACA